MIAKTCSVEGCDRPHRARTYCSAHWRRNHKYGSPTSGEPPRILDDDVRLWSQIDKSGECWVWTGTLSPYGYGQVARERRTQSVHRIVYTLLVGPIPDGLHLDHLCRNRACANPQHLEPVTHAENMRRGERATRPTCPEGHPYDRTLVDRKGRTARRCLTCHNARERERRARIRGASA